MFCCYKIIRQTNFIGKKTFENMFTRSVLWDSEIRRGDNASRFSGASPIAFFFSKIKCQGDFNWNTHESRIFLRAYASLLIVNNEIVDVPRNLWKSSKKLTVLRENFDFRLRGWNAEDFLLARIVRWKNRMSGSVSRNCESAQQINILIVRFLQNNKMSTINCPLI